MYESLKEYIKNIILKQQNKTKGSLPGAQLSLRRINCCIRLQKQFLGYSALKTKATPFPKTYHVFIAFVLVEC